MDPLSGLVGEVGDHLPARRGAKSGGGHLDGEGGGHEVLHPHHGADALLILSFHLIFETFGWKAFACALESIRALGEVHTLKGSEFRPEPSNFDSKPPREVACSPTCSTAPSCSKCSRGPRVYAAERP